MVSEPDEPIPESKPKLKKAIPKARQKLIDEYEKNDISELYHWLLNKKIEDIPEFQRPDPVNVPDSDSSFDPFTLHKRLFNEFALPSSEQPQIK